MCFLKTEDLCSPHDVTLSSTTLPSAHSLLSRPTWSSVKPTRLEMMSVLPCELEVKLADGIPSNFAS